MSYFVCIGVPEESVCIFEKYPVLTFSECPSGPLRELVSLGGKYQPYLVLHNGHSGNIIKPVSAKKSVQPHFASFLMEFADAGYNMVLFLHLSRGDLRYEKIESKGKMKISYEDLVALFPAVEVGMSYRVSRSANDQMGSR